MAAIPPRVIPTSFIKLGALSYGLYIIHYPILKLFGQAMLFSGHWYTYLARYVLFIGISLLAAYWLEKKLQPWARRLFYKPVPVQVSA